MHVNLLLGTPKTKMWTFHNPKQEHFNIYTLIQ